LCSIALRPFWAEIDLDHLAGNIRQIRDYVGEGVEIMAVVKADAYGIGCAGIMETLLENGISRLGVGILDEGLQLRKSGVELPILVFGYTPFEYSELLVEQMMELCVLDEYPSEQFHFQVQGFSITVKDEKLANALTALSEEKRSIVMLSYFMNMTDQEIGDRLNIVRRTVQYKRTSSLKEMKRMLELDI